MPLIKKMKNNSSGTAVAVLLLSICILLLLSLVPWSDLSNGRIRDFSLFEDLKTEKKTAKTNELIDPQLEAAIEELSVESAQETEEQSGSEQQQSENAGSFAADTVPAEPAIEKIDGIQPLEDYTADGSGLARFAAALANSGRRPVRVAVIGDSYIEGDIFTQDVRRLLQKRYGGRGVGYMSMHSDFPGFRRSVIQSDKGWTVVDMRHARRDSIKTISGEYCVGTPESQASFRGVKDAEAGAWSRSRLMFISPESGTLRLSTDSGETSCEVEASSDVQCLTVDGETTFFNIVSGTDRIMVLGAWLEDPTGISVDCMSLRGNSGVSHRSISVHLAAEMSQYTDYDLIIMEFGMNALSSEQTEYSAYGQLMAKTIARLRACYPRADIIMLGVGDRGQKNGSEIESLPTVSALTAAQRNCAQRSGVVFWDIRAAMGGENSVVDWRKRGLVNADYIHLNHKGGAVLAEEFVKALTLKTDEY